MLLFENTPRKQSRKIAFSNEHLKFLETATQKFKYLNRDLTSLLIVMGRFCVNIRNSFTGKIHNFWNIIFRANMIFEISAKLAEQVLPYVNFRVFLWLYDIKLISIFIEPSIIFITLHYCVLPYMTPTYIYDATLKKWLKFLPG